MTSIGVSSNRSVTNSYDHEAIPKEREQRPSLDTHTHREPSLSRISVSSSMVPDSNDFHEHVLFNESQDNVAQSSGLVAQRDWENIEHLEGEMESVSHSGTSNTVRVPSVVKPSMEESRNSPAKSTSAITNDERPPTSNTLLPKERELLVRKNRKLAQIFGADPLLVPLTLPQRHQRIVSEQFHPTSSARGRQSSSPLSPTAIASFLKNQEQPPKLFPPLRSPFNFPEYDDDEEDSSLLTGSLSLPPSPLSESAITRKQKRVRLAKLHRYLGSGVPAELVLGITDTMRDQDLPQLHDDEQEEGNPKWLALPRRRRSSSSAAFPVWDESQGSRMKDELSDREKATNVKRAQKMERMFGDRPPQALYHTRSPAPPFDDGESLAANNINRTAYTKPLRKSTKGGSAFRPGTAESSDSAKHLLGSEGETFKRFRDSLNSLSDIVDRDDRQSIAAIHRLLRTPSEEDIELSPPASQIDSPELNSTIKNERRRSLPITRKDSLLSLNSHYSATSPSPEQTSFQLRRKRAAKLADFFGVDYRELFDDVLAAFELGVAEESGRGSLKPVEAQLLLNKLRRLRAQSSQVRA